MDIKEYFQDELDFLHKEGMEFSALYPKLAGLLSEKSNDPDIERLLEGFAFLTARLRQRIDDEFPELTHSLLSLLWPNYLRHIPSMCMVRFYPVRDSITETKVIERSALLKNSQDDRDVIKFKTASTVNIYPLEIHDIKDKHTRTKSTLNIIFRSYSGLPICDIGLDDLVIYLGDSFAKASDLYLWLLEYVEDIKILHDGKEVKIESCLFEALGFGDEESLLPYPGGSFSGYRILQEYFSFQEKFLFLKLKNLGRYVKSVKSSEINLEIIFSRTFPSALKLTPDSIMLYCSPAINIFEMSGEPITVKSNRNEYQLTPDFQRSGFYSIFSVDKVEGWLLSSGGKLIPDSSTEYHAFESFKHEVEFIRNRRITYYRIKVGETLSKKDLEYKISFLHEDASAAVTGSDVVSVDMTCSNGMWPFELSIGDICYMSDNTPSYLSFSNITRPTRAVLPVLDGGMHWRLISNLSLNYVSLLNKDALISIISTYDFLSQHDKQSEKTAKRRYQGIKSLESSPVDLFFKGLPIRGIRSTIKMDDSFFLSEGDMYIFSSVLAEFLSLYASINSFHVLKVINERNNEVYEWSWNPKKGLYPLI